MSSNPHLGVIVSYWISKETSDQLSTLRELTGRCVIDIINMALRHRDAHQTLYGDFIGGEPRPKCRKIRVSLAKALNLAEKAWHCDLSRSRYIADTLTFFLQQIDPTELCSTLQQGLDIEMMVLSESCLTTATQSYREPHGTK